MQCEILDQDDGRVIRLAGRLDAFSTPIVGQAISQAVAAGGGPVTVDCGGVSYISSAGLRVLLVGAKAMKASGRRLRLAEVQAEVHEVITLAGMESFFDIALAVEG